MRQHPRTATRAMANNPRVRRLEPDTPTTADEWIGFAISVFYAVAIAVPMCWLAIKLEG